MAIARLEALPFFIIRRNFTSQHQISLSKNLFFTFPRNFVIIIVNFDVKIKTNCFLELKEGKYSFSFCFCCRYHKQTAVLTKVATSGRYVINGSYLKLHRYGTYLLVYFLHHGLTQTSTD